MLKTICQLTGTTEMKLTIEVTKTSEDNTLVAEAFMSEQKKSE